MVALSLSGSVPAGPSSGTHESSDTGGFQFKKEHNSTKTHNRGDDLTLKIRWPKSRTNEPIWGRCAATAGSREWGPLGESRGDREQSLGPGGRDLTVLLKRTGLFERIYFIFAQLCNFL